MQAWLIIWTIMAVFYAILFFQKPIMAYFNMVDKRILIGNKASQQLAQLMQAADVSINYYHYRTLANFSLRISQDRSDKESISARFEGDNPDKVVAEAYKWALERGVVTK